MRDDRRPGGARELTGRKLVLLERGAGRAMARALDDANFNVVVASDLAGGVTDAIMKRSDAVLFDHASTMILPSSSPAAASIINEYAAQGRVLKVEEERYVYAIGAPALDRTQLGYLRGYRDGVHSATDLCGRGPALEEPVSRGRPVGEEPASRGSENAERPSRASAVYRFGVLQSETDEDGAAARAVAGEHFDESKAAWGLQVIGADRSPYTGKGINIAILDTGIDEEHVDFIDRAVDSRSFVEGQGIQDWHGHGTHTAGIACGRPSLGVSTRYGVATGADLYVCKVLDNCGVGTDGTIIAGVDWALGHGCRVISMSLGLPLDRPLAAYETIGQRAMDRNALIIAAAGNDSDRRALDHRRRPTNSPANATTILAVAALDPSRGVAFFSNGGKIDVAAPGMYIYSSYKCNRYRYLSGTSMATPYVAGVVALLMEQNPRASAREIRDQLLATVQPLGLPREDVGIGLVQAPT